VDLSLELLDQRRQVAVAWRRRLGGLIPDQEAPALVTCIGELRTDATERPGSVILAGDVRAAERDLTVLGPLGPQARADDGNVNVLDRIEQARPHAAATFDWIVGHEATTILL